MNLKKILNMAKKLTKVNLVCYTIRFREKNSKADNHLFFSELFPKGFINFAQEFIKSIELDTYQSQDKEFILDVINPDLTLGNRGILTGQFDKGTKAKTGAAIKEKKARKSVVLKKIGGDEYTTNPYFFLLGLPTDKPKVKGCVFMAQTYGIYGFKEVFTDVFRLFVKNRFNDEIICDINTLTNPKLFEKVIKTSSVRKLRYKKHSLPETLDDMLDGGIKNEKDRDFFDVELSISVRKGGFLNMRNTLQKMVSGTNSFIELSEGNNFEYDEVLADVQLGNNKRVINISKPASFGAVYDVEKEIEFDNDGIPNLESIRDIALDIYEEDILTNVDL